MKKLCSALVLFMVIAAMCSCGSEPASASPPSPDQIASYLDKSTAKDLKDCGTVTFWKISRQEILSEVNDSVSSQNLFDSEFTVEESESGNAYYLFRDGHQTNCQLVFRFSDDGEITLVRPYCKVADHNSLEDFVILASGTMQASFSALKSFESGYSALNQLYYGARDVVAPAVKGYEARFTFEFGDESISLSISRKSPEDISEQESKTEETQSQQSATYNEPNTNPLPETDNQKGSDDVVINTARHDDDMICICAQDIVKQYLPTPSTAKFCKWSEMVKQDLGNGHYQCTGWVDAQNEYGAMMRYDFLVYYTATEEGYKEGGAELFPHGQ